MIGAETFVVNGDATTRIEDAIRWAVMHELNTRGATHVIDLLTKAVGILAAHSSESARTQIIEVFNGHVEWR